MSQHTGSHKNSLNLLSEKYLNESHWPMRRIRLLECNIQAKNNKGADQTAQADLPLYCSHMV